MFLTLLFLITSIGLTINVHYCGGKIQSVQLLLESPGCCCGEDREMNDCCTDQSFFVQLDTDQFLSPLQEIEFKYHQADLTSDLPRLVRDPVSADLPLFSTELRPPPNQDRRLLFCSLTYYG